jgi:hypothetical protein
MIYFWLRDGQGDYLYGWTSLAGVYWAITGAFLSGETAQLSPRAKRRLPQSFLGRMLFTWFNPGSGTGYVFAMLNLLGVMGFAGSSVLIAHLIGYEHLPKEPEWATYNICVVGYVLGYLGFVRLAIIALRQITPIGMLASFLCQVLGVLCGVLFPLLIQSLMSWGNYGTFNYSLLQLPNFWWTLYEIVHRRALGGYDLAVMVGSVGGVIFLINLLVAAREVEHVRQAAPQRIVEDDQALHPAPRRKRNPWDEEVASGA